MSSVRARLFCVAALALCAGRSLGVTSPVLDLSGQTLTAYAPTAVTPVQGLSPRHDQRGVDIDGTLRSPATTGWALAADPLGGGYGSGRTVGDVNLFTGGYHPTEIDLALPSLGLPIVVGRAYNNLQVSGGSAVLSSGPQGSNWSQLAQPELVFTAGSGGGADTLTLVYGADRYIEFARISPTGDAYKAKNGAAGVVVRTAGSGADPETFTYYDQRGNATTFLGFDTNAGAAKGQLWKATDPAGRVSYVGSTSSAGSAISTGYDSAGRMLLAFDASGRKYVFTYASVDGATRLTGVEALVDSGGTWFTVASVAYGYYSNADGGTNGLSGDLKTATVTMKGTGSIDHARTKYYRYYTESYADSTGRRGQPGALRLVVGSEGVRRYNADVSANGYLTASDAALTTYADASFEYLSDRRLKNATLNGSCGCSGGTTGLYQFAYQDVSSTPTLAMGRVIRSVDATGTIRRTVFDERGLPTERSVGTNDAGLPGSTSSGTSDMVTTEKLEYDNAATAGGGNGYLTKRTLEDDGVWATTADQRVTTIHNDYRGRAVAQVNPLPPHSVQSYDNLNRPRLSAQYKGSGSSLSSSSVGASSLVGTEYPEPQIATNLFIGVGEAAGSHDGFLDDLNRPTTTRWHKTAYASGGTEPRFVDFQAAYDQVNNPIWVQDNVLSSSSSSTMVRSFDRKPVYDTLRRVASLEEGELNSGGTAIASRSRYESLARTFAGRIDRDCVDLDGATPPSYTNGPPSAKDMGEMDDQRTYNKRNELRTRVVKDSVNPAGVTVTLTYDKNGNLTSDGEKYTYVFNPFGQLVRIGKYGSTTVLSEFAYSGLGHRIAEQTDVNDSAGTGKPDGAVDSSDTVFYIATDPQGRRVATFRKNDAYPKETFVWTPAGVSGPGGNVGGALILRDRVGDATKPEYWAISAADETRPERHYYCSDSRLSVVALIGLRAGKDGPTGTLAEQYRYSATGVPYGIPLGDVNGNGRVEIVAGSIVDKQAVDLISASSYQARADLDLDGVVDSVDVAIVDLASGAESGRGALGLGKIGNLMGLNHREAIRGTRAGWIEHGDLYSDLLGARVSFASVLAYNDIYLSVSGDDGIISSFSDSDRRGLASGDLDSTYSPATDASPILPIALMQPAPASQARPPKPKTPNRCWSEFEQRVQQCNMQEASGIRTCVDGARTILQRCLGGAQWTPQTYDSCFELLVNLLNGCKKTNPESRPGSPGDTRRQGCERGAQDMFNSCVQQIPPSVVP